MKPALFTIISILILYSCNSTEEENGPSAPVTPAIKYKEVNYFLHDTTLFTEGLLVHEGQLFESTGSPDITRRSLIGINDLKTGNFIKKVELANKDHFGEGIVFFKDKLYQLTYKNQVGFIYDAKTYKEIGQFKNSNKEGWGFTTDGTNLIMSDGTDSLTYLNPNDLKPARKISVTENGVARDSLNELEYIRGYIYANIWLTNNIVKINPADGKVVGKLDLSQLAFKAMLLRPDCDVLNGIAYDSTTDFIYVTGKLWPHIYQIQLTAK
ncbi:glutaminyl-peptide cyclotransferase [Niastella caeni]|uniref:Glutaminyl-peptide cyclotransferase n=1 Tax=Niastella caeni TaxID=2569763 RepID=A0A4S8HUH3_9BACT|nr:glutaminyl-peptide cyclotransferase [Niastella caeni]THU39257.1 glutaminyl-peptide cyclotransferase [Niastella caeni]